MSKVQCAREALYICQESDHHLPDITDVSGRLLLLRIGSALEIQIPRQFHSRGMVVVLEHCRMSSHVAAVALVGEIDRQLSSLIAMHETA